MASPTQWTWVCASSGRQWRTGKPGVLQPMGLQRVGHNLVTEQLSEEPGRLDFLSVEYPGVWKTKIPRALCKNLDGTLLTLLFHCFLSRRSVEWVYWKGLRNSFDTERKIFQRCLEAESPFLCSFSHQTVCILPANLCSHSCLHKCSYSGCSLLTSLPCWPVLGSSEKLASMCSLGRWPWALQTKRLWGL